MPTGVNAALVPTRPETKARLKSRKGRASYDEYVNALLDSAPPARVDAFLAEPVYAQIEAPSRGPPTGEAPGTERAADKQLLVAELARRRFTLWLAQGVVERIGPRRLRFRPPSAPDETGVRVVRRPGRGLPS
ncbi:MAG: hypothetical protein ACT4PT_07185 [Methanobacteriota archaeon]